MGWLLTSYTLHTLAVLAAVLWALRLERRHLRTKETLRTVVKMIDRDLDELREERDGQMLRVAEMLVDIRAGVRTLLTKGEDDGKE